MYHNPRRLRGRPGGRSRMKQGRAVVAGRPLLWEASVAAVARSQHSCCARRQL